jgi:SAM-dependent methyltransferase
MQVEDGLEMTTTLRTRPCPDCYLCGRRGVPLYRGLRDLVFGVPGGWSLSICPDPGCRLIWMDPLPAAEDLGAAYRVYYTHETARGSGPLERFQEIVAQGYLRGRRGFTRGVGSRWYRWLAPLAVLLPGGGEEIEGRVIFQGPPAPGARVLDVGCGHGGLLSRLRDLGWDVEGTEVDGRAVAEARARGVPVHHGELADRAYPDDHFDLVHLGHVIEHVYDPVGLLRECRRLLKPGGGLVVLTPNARSWGHRHFGRDWRGLEPPRHLHLFDVDNLAVVARRAGFARVEARSLQRASRTVLVVSAMLRHCRRSGRELGGCYNLGWKLRGTVYQFWERALVRFRPDAGEEVLCIARKD